MAKQKFDTHEKQQSKVAKPTEERENSTDLDRTAQVDPLAQHFAQSGSAAKPGAQTALLNHATSGNLTHAPQTILQLQQMYGNRYVQEAVQTARQSNSSNAPVPQPKLENKTGLPDDLKTGIETLSGISMDDVKVHYNSSKPAELQALAYTQGTDIHVGPGQEKHLPHEAWHIVQQKQKRVNPTEQMKGKININDDAGLEKEADLMGAKALQMTHGHQVATRSNSQTSTFSQQSKIGASHSSVAFAVPGSVSKPVVQMKGAKWRQYDKKKRQKRMQDEHDMLWKQRANLTEIHQYDEEAFDTYLNSQKKPVTVYRGDGRGVTQDALQNYIRQDIDPKPGEPDVSFRGVVAHTHSNSSPGGMVSTTSDEAQAIEWASDSHTWSLVYEIELSDYIDVNSLLAQRNFRNRYQKQYEFLIPRAIKAQEIKSVSLYSKGGTLVDKSTF